MLKKYFPLIVLIAAAGLFVYIKMHQRGPVVSKPTISVVTDPVSDPKIPPPPSDHPNREEGLDRRTSHIFYSKHARCRMDCRHIDEAEVQQILKDGKINYTKSELQGEDCKKKYAVEGYTKDNQHVRMIFAPCNTEVTVVTVIDLGKEWQCSCE